MLAKHKKILDTIRKLSQFDTFNLYNNLLFTTHASTKKEQKNTKNIGPIIIGFLDGSILLVQ